MPLNGSYYNLDVARKGSGRFFTYTSQNKRSIIFTGNVAVIPQQYTDPVTTALRRQRNDMALAPCAVLFTQISRITHCACAYPGKTFSTFHGIPMNINQLYKMSYLTGFTLWASQGILGADEYPISGFVENSPLWQSTSKLLPFTIIPTWLVTTRAHLLQATCVMQQVNVNTREIARKKSFE